jgi:hypothetical protein
MSGQRIGYIRVSTLDQQTERQLDVHFTSPVPVNRL